MRKCTRFHFGDIEEGDEFQFDLPDDERDDLDEPRHFRGTIRSKYTTHNFGEVLEVYIGYTYTATSIYLEDGWNITYIPKAASTATPTNTTSKEHTP